MIILHAAPIVWRKISGHGACVPRLIAAQNRLDGVEAALVVTKANRGQPPDMGFPVFNQKMHLNGAGGLNLPRPFDRPDLVVLHGIYIPVQAAIAAKLRKAAIPYVICPHGGMTRYAQAYRWWKKRLANLFFFNKMVNRAAAVNYLTRGEAEASGGWNRSMFVVGNGIDIPAESDLASPGQSARLRLVFIGRLAVEHKGLDMLLEACTALRPELLRRHARIELHGPSFRGGTGILAQLIARSRLEKLVTLHGPVLGAAKRLLLQQADVFLHTSRWEGHPMAVLEALAHGVPCLLTTPTNMAEEVAAAGAGWKVEPSPAAIAAGFEKVLMAGRDRLAQAGAKARRLAVEKYAWDRIAAESVGAYRKYAA